MKRLSIALCAICAFGCATAPCPREVNEDDDGDDQAVTPRVMGGQNKHLPPPMTLKEMATVVRELPKLDCKMAESNITLTLKGRLDTFKYGQRGLKKGFQVCLIGEITEWRPLPELCRDYVPGAEHVYTFGPISLPKKNQERFTFANVVGRLEYRWTGVKWVNPTGACRAHMGENGEMDLLVFTKRERPGEN